MTSATKSTLIGLFETRTAAENAVGALINAGFSRDYISVVSNDTRTSADVPDIGMQPATGSGTDAGAGAFVGGLAGFVGGIVALAIPGIGPIIAAGPLAAGLMGAGIGAATGGVVGALKSHGVPENDASRFSEAIRAGRVMVSVEVPEDRVDTAADIMDRNGAIDVDETDEHIATTSGGTETTFRPPTPEALEAVRLKPEDSLVARQRERERRVHVYPGITGMGTGPNT